MVSGGVSPLAQEGWTNADAVKDFLDAHPQGTRYEAGDLFVLPDIEQTFTVEGVRFFRQPKGARLYLDFRVRCAIEECEEEFLVTRSVQEMRSSPHMTRCCPEHRGMWKTVLPNAWRTQEELQVQRDAKATREAIRAERGRTVGVVEDAVLKALRTQIEVCGNAPVEMLIHYAALLLPRPAQRDTRRQRVQRAIQNLQRKGLLRRDGQLVVLQT